jgi:hypothetical protein
MNLISSVVCCSAAIIASALLAVGASAADTSCWFLGIKPMVYDIAPPAERATSLERNSGFVSIGVITEARNGGGTYSSGLAKKAENESFTLVSRMRCHAA